MAELISSSVPAATVMEKALMNELRQGEEMARQLRNHLTSSSSSHQNLLFLIQQLISSYDKAISSLNSLQIPSPNQQPNCNPSRDQLLVRPSSEKRKTLSKCGEQVMRVSSGSSREGFPVDDFCWRKYGQKDILGSNHPRGYYRCSHRYSQGCLATKQVQRSNDDPTTFEVTYRRRHTCNSAISLQDTSHQLQQHEAEKQNKPRQEDPEVKVVEEKDLDSKQEDMFFSFSSFPWTATEESAEIENFALHDHIISSTPTSVSDSSVWHLDFSLDNVELEADFPFENFEFSS